MFVGINQMKYSAKKRKKEQEAERDRAEQQQQQKKEMNKCKENNNKMPTGTGTDTSNDEQEQETELATDISAPLQISTNNKEKLQPPELLSSATNNQPEPATLKRTEYSTATTTIPTTLTTTTTTTSEPADITSTCKWKNCQCNLQNDSQLKENKHCHPAHGAATSPAICHQQYQPTSLVTVYICLGILTLALASLSVLFYSHVVFSETTCQNFTSSEQQHQHRNEDYRHSFAPTMDKFSKDFSSSLLLTTSSQQQTVSPTSSPPPPPPPASLSTSSSLLFREQFHQELLASELMLQSMIEKILLQQASGAVEHKQQQQEQQQQQLHQNEKHLPLGNLNDQR